MAPDYDVLVIGGGIHGAGAAQAAAAAGYRALLLEKKALAAGTSSRSSKLIHGGLRYLETFQLELVRESLQERAILLRIAPDLVRLAPFHLPIYPETSRRPWKISIGLSLYSLLARGGPGAGSQKVPRREWDGLDGLRTDGLQAVFRYQDACTDDAALTRAVAASAASLGAVIECPATLRAAKREEEGWLVRYETAGTEKECRASAVVNAAGPWANESLSRFAPAVPPHPIELVQGSHAVIEGTIERGFYYVEAPADRRAVFVMPWKRGSTLVGTTETPFSGKPDEVRPLPAELDYLKETFRRYFPERSWTLRESFAGLRVLPKEDRSPFHRPRGVFFGADDPARPRLVTVYGGKLTGYRSTSRKVMRILSRSLPPATPIADTATLPLQPAS